MPLPSAPNERQVVLETERFRVVRNTFPTEDGRRHVRDTVEHPGAVVILPLLEDGRVCLVRNMRISVGQILIELPAGALNVGEDPAAAARRELREETGYQAGRLEPMLSFHASPGILDEQMHLYRATELVPGRQQLEPGEQIETMHVSMAEALAMIADGGIRDAKTIIGLLLQAHGVPAVG